jgi:hypothetical protein
LQWASASSTAVLSALAFASCTCNSSSSTAAEGHKSVIMWMLQVYGSLASADLGKLVR